MAKGVPTTLPADGTGVIVAAPLVVERGPAGALVIETAARVDLTEDDLELLALFSSQAAVAIRNTHELERLRSGALAALGRMAAQVAHELKNPLAGLRLYARHLEQHLAKGGDASGAALAQKVSSTVDHLASVVSEITAFGRPPELHRERLSIHGLLDDCLSLAQARTEGTAVEVRREYDEGCPDGLFDPKELRKAFLNLILNGLEALGAGGRLTVATAYAPDTRTVTVTIEDTGAGMNEETRSRMFDLFFTTKPQGTGLGMAIVRSVIDLHGGTLAIHSVLGEGTRIAARLPLEPAEPAA
jgi:two-component system sensor histidine kinase HydH